MSVARKSGTKPLAFVTALMVVLALVVPFVGTAVANHAGQTVSGFQLTPENDNAAAGTCNAFTVTLTGATSTGDTNPGVPGETVDVEVIDTDADDNGALGGGANVSDVVFCTPTDTTANDNVDDNPQLAQTAESDNCGGVSNPGGATCISGEVGPTNEDGEVTFGIQSSESGTFLVRAFYEPNDNNDDPDNNEFQDTSTKTFGPGGSAGVTAVDCEPETDSNPIDTRHSFTCTARNAQGQAVPGVPLSFDVTAGPNAEEQGPQQCSGGTTANPDTTPAIATDTTDQNGQIVCSYQDAPTGTSTSAGGGSPAGTDTIIGFIEQSPPAGQTGGPGPQSFEPQDEITKSWVGAANKIDCQPDNANAQSGTVQTVVCTVTDAAGNPVPDVEVDFSEEGPGRIITQIEVRTNNAGQARVEVQTAENEVGTQTITGRIDPSPNTGTPASGVNPATNCTGTNEGPPSPNPNNTVCSDTASYNWQQDVTTDDPQCSDGVDNDGDGFTDFPDDPHCGDAFDDNEAFGGGRFPTAVTIRYNRKASPPAFKGAVATDYEGCSNQRRIVLKKKRPGKDRVVGRDLSNNKGNWKIVKRRARGRYYAVAPRKQFTVDGATVICLRDTSVTITVRRRG